MDYFSNIAAKALSATPVVRPARISWFGLGAPLPAEEAEGPAAPSTESQPVCEEGVRMTREAAHPQVLTRNTPATLAETAAEEDNRAISSFSPDSHEGALHEKRNRPIPSSSRRVNTKPHEGGLQDERTGFNTNISLETDRSHPLAPAVLSRVRLRTPDPHSMVKSDASGPDATPRLRNRISRSIAAGLSSDAAGPGEGAAEKGHGAPAPAGQKTMLTSEAQPPRRFPAALLPGESRTVQEVEIRPLLQERAPDPGSFRRKAAPEMNFPAAERGTYARALDGEREDSPHDVHINIGRIEVRATAVPQSSRKYSPAPNGPSALEKYLNRRARVRDE